MKVSFLPCCFRLLVAILIAFTMNVFAGTPIPASAHKGIWAVEGKPLYDGLDPLQTGVQSPDRTMTVQATPTGVVLVESGKSVHLDVVFTPGLAEVLWSPDSKYLVINASDGGGWAPGILPSST